MGLPTLENGPYVFNVNNYFAESSNLNKQKRWKLELKNCLVALGGSGVIWDVVASSDSVSYVNIGGGSPDLWVDISDIVGASAGSPHSWLILENQTTGAQLLIDQASTNYYACNIKYSPGGLYGTGDASNAPTATDEESITTTSYQSTANGATYTKIVVHVMASADHKTTRFYIHEKDDASASCGGFIGLIEEIVDTPSQWISTDKTVILAHLFNLNFSTTPLAQSPYLYDIDGAYWKAYLETSDPYAGWESCYPTTESYGNLAGNGGDGLMWVNVNLEVQGGFPVPPIGLFRTSGSYSGFYGRLRDLYFGQITFDTLTQYPNDPSRLWIKFGCFLLPWNGTIPVNIP